MPWDDDLDEGSPAYGIAASDNHRIRVVAGPGAGKSFAMKRRVARLLEDGVAPRQILPVTFTRVAAQDLHRELIGMGVPGCEELEGVTLHSLALRLLMRRHVLEATGRTPRPLMTLSSVRWRRTLDHLAACAKFANRSEHMSQHGHACNMTSPALFKQTKTLHLNEP